jgi:hypothetical protein
VLDALARRGDCSRVKLVCQACDKMKLCKACMSERQQFEAVKLACQESVVVSQPAGDWD